MRKIPRPNNARPAMMKIPTATFRLAIDSLRNESASDGILALAHFFDRPKGDNISLVKDGDPVSHSTDAVYIVRNDYQSSTVRVPATHQKLIDFGGRDAIQTAAWLIGQQDLRAKYQRSRKSGPLPHTSRKCRRIFVTMCP